MRVNARLSAADHATLAGIHRDLHRHDPTAASPVASFTEGPAPPARRLARPEGHPMTARVIRAELSGDGRIDVDGETLRHRTPILHACRVLLAKGYPPETELRCFRGQTPCMVVRHIGKAAGVDLVSCSTPGARRPSWWPWRSPTAFASPRPPPACPGLAPLFGRLVGGISVPVPVCRHPDGTRRESVQRSVRAVGYRVAPAPC